MPRFALKARTTWFLAALLFALGGIWSATHHDGIAALMNFALGVTMTSIGVATNPAEKVCQLDETQGTSN